MKYCIILLMVLSSTVYAATPDELMTQIEANCKTVLERDGVEPKECAIAREIYKKPAASVKYTVTDSGEVVEKPAGTYSYYPNGSGSYTTYGQYASYSSGSTYINAHTSVSKKGMVTTRVFANGQQVGTSYYTPRSYGKR